MLTDAILEHDPSIFNIGNHRCGNASVDYYGHIFPGGPGFSLLTPAQANRSVPDRSLEDGTGGNPACTLRSLSSGSAMPGTTDRLSRGIQTGQQWPCGGDKGVIEFPIEVQQFCTVGDGEAADCARKTGRRRSSNALSS